MSGTLYVVSTPIGNLEDITLRALRILKEVAIIAAEDTRHTQKLLSHFDIHTTLTSYHDFNKEEKTPVLLSKMAEGASIAIVSDAGTPTLSDPGFYLIREAIRAGLPVSPIPGPSAALAALAVSGLPPDRFVFEGFLPKKKGARARRLEQLKPDPRTLIFYESPFRIVGLLEEIKTILGDRPVVVAREITKMFEEFIRGSVTEVLERIGKKTMKGEITLVVGGNREED
ncbi:MAG: 16S rRNA (cytidine(1402)-2'-O)-methyltransferase [Candidatus Manganitrophus sp.]|nr:16S rRNA (cytidine(1402)-2'-O)-methyltransferase [Candidatus Manganitrophus sp.]MDC4223175.1 16S rRNA (cytidine(1402)-2'-O)-methyltransferase [Candidatus Manganitrophus sp.]WDT69468.1 MAG: 16S rRNA (cytidine(1402)-2'-O)-methyltransferase [Candidatus Manganitrophus sp.]WDT78945.1 MAG: 16S rRNA (cytidine(1402)-2'-O)-methyltransferase [Candidatus Manganitrophus sp.]